MHGSVVLREREKWWDGGYDPSKQKIGGMPETVEQTIAGVFNASSGWLASYVGSDQYEDIDKYREDVMQWIHETNAIAKDGLSRLLVQYNRKYNKQGKQDLG
jgi:hypothetical protein